MGAHYGLQHDAEWHGVTDLRIKFRIVSARLDKGPSNKRAVDIQAKVVSVTSDRGSTEGAQCVPGSQVGLYAESRDRRVVSFGCGAILHAYHRFTVFKAVGTAISG